MIWGGAHVFIYMHGKMRRERSMGWLDHYFEEQARRRRVHPCDAGGQFCYKKPETKEGEK
jgi:hypothetical protein